MRKICIGTFLILISVFTIYGCTYDNTVIKEVDREDDILNKKAELLCEEGLRLEEKGEISGAEKKFKAALESNPKCGPAYTFLGELYQSQKRYAEAESIYKKQIEIYPEGPLTWNNLAALYILQERWQDAQQAYQRSLEINWNQPDVMNEMRRLEEKIKELERR